MSTYTVVLGLRLTRLALLLCLAEVDRLYRTDANSHTSTAAGPVTCLLRTAKDGGHALPHGVTVGAGVTSQRVNPPNPAQASVAMAYAAASSHIGSD
ncbi:hypothetical protein CH063_15364 [Colletotrichum higginsianum]|uniref:Secreted protein n=1 Tax=Colletotrichum higginsianum (strain IMI 349063) TaxID=759273 RepID=H1W2H1_COLHI|nr:hypothetical protein CH063_15364 [Colletotrichum higginsianum]